MAKCQNYFKNIKAQLKKAKIEAFEFESKLIFEEFLGPSWMLKEDLPTEVCQKIESLVQKRCTHYPLQYLLGHWEFWGLDFFVGEGVLIPRPETELLVDEALKVAKNTVNPTIVDLFSGSGCVGITIAKEVKTAQVLLVEKDPQAFYYLNKNLKKHSLSNAQAFCANAVNFCAEKPVDIVTANPPYLTADELKTLQEEVKHEPAIALAGGKDGLYFYKAAVSHWAPRLRPGATAIFEFSSSQAQETSYIFKAAGFAVKIVKDLESRDRCIVATKK